MADTTVAHDTIYIPRGDTFTKAWPLTDADTYGVADPTGWTARCEVRDKVGGNLITQFHSDRTGHSSWPGVITFDGSGNLVMTLTPAQTAALALISNAVFDVELINPGATTVTRIVKGRAHVTPEVTTDA